VSLMKTSQTTDDLAAAAAGVRDRAMDAAAQVVPAAKSAGTTAVQGVRQGVQGAKEWAAPRIEDAVLGAREWAAPQLEAAADAVTGTVAPKVSSALRQTASQVRPPGPKKTGIRSLVDWRWLLGLGAAAAAAGAGAAIAMRRRYASATEEAKNATEPPGEDAATPGDAAMRSDVNGRVTTAPHLARGPGADEPGT
jgi:hypothetical protein